MDNILLIGSGAREHALAEAIKKSQHKSKLFCFGEFINPKIAELSESYQIGDLNNIDSILEFAKKNYCNFAIVGPEKPLEKGVADLLEKHEMPTIGPKKSSAKLETDKSFARNLLKKYEINANPLYKIFTKPSANQPDFNDICDWINKLDGNYVIKANGLAGGKGVKVSGKHLFNLEEALDCCRDFFTKYNSIIIEEKFIGQEFSLHSFVDGENVIHMPLVQDHKAAYVGDKGPNTGGMGSFSDFNHSLPFLKESDVIIAKKINEAVIKALNIETKEKYKGILYGSYIATSKGIKVIEFNTRFGDPEALNLLPLLESDFIDICKAIISGNISDNLVKFKNMATVCKYVVPEGYPDNSVKDQIIKIDNVKNKNNLYYASVYKNKGDIYTMSSRSIAYVAIEKNIEKAYKISENEISKMKGNIFYRKDIGSKNVIKEKINFMKKIYESFHLT